MNTESCYFCYVKISQILGICFVLALFPHLNVASQAVPASQLLTEDLDSYHKCIC